MTYAEYKQMKEKEIEVSEQNLRGIIETELTLSDPDAPTAVDALAYYRKVLANPLLLRKAAKRFHDLFWNNDDVTEIEQVAATQALAEIAGESEPAPSPFTIIRDGKEIGLTHDEINSFKLSIERDEINGALEDWLDTLDDERAEDSAILAAMKDQRNKDKVLGLFDSSLLTEMLKTADDDDMDAYQRFVNKVFRPVCRKISD